MQTLRKTLERLRVAKNQQELDELDDDSTEIYKSNIIERYTIRPNNIPSVNNMCLAEFAAYYYKDYKTDISEAIDAQPMVLTDDIIAQLNVSTNDDTPSLPKNIRLMNGKEVMNCRKVKAVIRYHTQTRQRNLKDITTTFFFFTIHGDKKPSFLERNRLTCLNSLNLMFKL